MKRLIIQAILLLVLVSFPDLAIYQSFAQSEQSKSEYELGFSARNFMVRKYSMVEDEAMIARVRNIWKKVTRVAEKRIGVRYKIDILDTDSVGAWAYPGGFILITRGMVNLASTDDELAFVIAHELGHQSRGHVDRPIEPELTEKYQEIITEHGIDGQGFVNEFVNEISRQKEIDADHSGVIYLTLAGYDTSAAFSILDKVVVQDKSKTHPDIETRQRKIQERLQAIIDKLEVFEAGVIFYNIGEYRYAEGAFQNFLSVYPSREVYNNLATTYYQEALIHYTLKRDIPTKKTTQIDFETRASQIQAGARGVWDEDEEGFREALNEAINAYNRAIEQDPEYEMSFNNLGCAYDELGEFDMALARLKKAIRLRNDYKEAYNNLGVVYIHLEEFEEAVTSLKKAIQLDAGYADAYFNLAMAYEALGEPAELVNENLRLFLKYNPDKGPSSSNNDARERLGMQIDSETTDDLSSGRREIIKRKKLEEVIGAPTHSIDVMPLDRKIIRIHLYPEKEVKLITYGVQGSAKLSSLDTVICIIANGKSMGGTPENVQVGDAKEKLIATYGEPKEITEMGGLLNYIYPQKSVLFSLRDESVVSWVLWFDLEQV